MDRRKERDNPSHFSGVGPEIVIDEAQSRHGNHGRGPQEACSIAAAQVEDETDPARDQ